MSIFTITGKKRWQRGLLLLQRGLRCLQVVLVLMEKVLLLPLTFYFWRTGLYFAVTCVKIIGNIKASDAKISGHLIFFSFHQNAPVLG